MTYTYKTDGVNGSLGVMAVRVAVGLPIGLVAGFVGNILNSIVVPSPVAGDNVAFLVRVFVLGFAASTGGMVAWFNLLDSKIGGVVVWVIGGLGGLIGGLVGYYVGDAFIDHPDVYILNQRLTQVVIFGAAAGSNVFSVVFSIVSARSRG
jgi:hypothetical protein